MGLNKLDNFIKNVEGRILYVSPSDIDATDSIDNTGNSLARPFKTAQRALIESARFSYIGGSNNDQIEKTTILLMPGEHIIDNRPGFKIKNVGNQAKVVSPGGVETFAETTLDLNLTSNFELTSEDNILYKFNSVNGGVIVPRGTSIVGLDLRKTKIRPLYVPNPTDNSVDPSAIFRITGTCYFWQFSIFDGNDIGKVYTDPVDFSVNNKSRPIFSHHKLSCFEYADGVNNVPGYDLTDLDMYYAKLSNAYGTGSGSPSRFIDKKYPENPDDFAKQRPEWEIVGAFATDPINIERIDRENNTVTVTTTTDHELSVGTPIKISGVPETEYNIATRVQGIVSSTKFTYLLPTFTIGLRTPIDQPDISGAEVRIETDTVTGASPYIFNISMRSVYGMNGMHADGSKASGFRSMVVAQFTGVSLQKDDRAFVKYNKSNREYEGVTISKVTGSELSRGSSSLDPNKIYHSDSEAIYRNGWEQYHIKMSNDAIVQIVSVFAIGYNKHFVCESGGDASVTNSNSNFGQLSLVSDGFKKEAFDKDNKAFITNIIPPKAIVGEQETIDWLSIDVSITTTVDDQTRLYLRGFNSENIKPPVLTQGYRVGAKVNDKLFVNIDRVDYEANILMENGIDNSFREFNVTNVSNSQLTITNHGLKTGEKVIILEDDANYPENIIPHVIYYIIKVNENIVKLAATKKDADNESEIVIYYSGSKLRVLSRVIDKIAGDPGHPVQFDSSNGWYINVNSDNGIYPQLSNLDIEETEPSFIRRIADNRSLDEKIYKFRVVVPKELPNAKTPESGFIIQESSTTGARNSNDFTISTITANDYEFKRNQRFIAECSHSSTTSTVRTEIAHNLDIGDKIIIKNVTDSYNIDGSDNSGYNGTFIVSSIISNYEFTYTNTQSPGSLSTNDTSIRNENLPRYERNDLQSNFYIYRNEVISQYIDGQQDGIYHLYALKSDAVIEDEFTNLKYGQNVTDLYPQLDRDNTNDSPYSTKTHAANFPIGEVFTSDLKNSITRETADTLITKLNNNLTVDSVSTLSGGLQTVIFTRDHGLGGLVKGSLENGGTGYNSNESGEFYNVKILTGGEAGTWNGATAKVVVVGGSIESLDIMSPGSGYTAETYYFDNSTIGSGGGTGARFTVSSSEIVNSIGDVVQITGISTVGDAYYRINSIPGTDRISIAKTSGDPDVIPGQIAIHVGPSLTISSASFNSGTTTFNCSESHGFAIGNRFRVNDVNNNYLGDFIVSGIVDHNSFQAVTTTQLSNPKYIFIHYFSSNSGSSDKSDENLAGRGRTFYAGDILTISGTSIGISETEIPISHPLSGTGIEKRFPLGSYIQVGNEIMRVSQSTLISSNKLSVIRGALGSKAEAHINGSLIRKIKPISIEFRRPSIIRASGHTFEYLGYGPGNYSTGLPQVQTRTITEKEEFLSQAQERSSGIVVYTGMNNRGDFYIGNTKKSSATGEETSFDTPIPTITGEDPARLSSIFDEIVIKERIVVEGGDSNEILSQFDGPVTFNGKVNFNNDIRIKNVKANDINTPNVSANILNADEINAGKITVDNLVRIDGRKLSSISGNLNIDSDNLVAIQTNTSISGSLNVVNNSTFNSGIDVFGHTEIDTLNVSGLSTFSNAVDINASVNIQNNLDVDGHTEIDNLNVSGLSTFISNVDINASVNIQNNLDVDGHTEIDNLSVSGLSTFSNAVDINASVNIQNNLDVGGNATFTGESTFNSGINVTGVITSTKFVGNGTIPVGGIIMWSGSIASIPTGWALCDGNNGTPNLRDKFIVGAGSGYSVDATGGSADTVVVSHTHGLDSTKNLSITDPGHTHGYVKSSGNTESGSGDDGGTISEDLTDSNTTGISITGTTESEGVSGTNANLPPYYALAFIMRTT